MLHSLVAHWYVPTIALVACILYVKWKASGGTILFKIKPTDDGGTQALKAIFGLGWTYGSVIVAICVGAASVVWLAASLVLAALGF